MRKSFRTVMRDAAAIAAATTAGLASVWIVAACASTPAAVDRTGGIALDLLWVSADNARASYFAIGTDGTFASAGGVNARARTPTFRTSLDAADLSKFVRLVEATSFATRASRAGDAGDLHEVIVVEHGRSSRFEVRGADSTLDPLVAFCREASLRQFRDVIDAQPQAGERSR